MFSKKDKDFLDKMREKDSVLRNTGLPERLLQFYLCELMCCNKLNKKCSYSNFEAFVRYIIHTNIDQVYKEGRNKGNTIANKGVCFKSEDIENIGKFLENKKQDDTLNELLKVRENNENCYI